jgi:hypothetical protein
MTRFRFALLVLFSCLPLTAAAAVTSGDFPEETVWYMHADLKEMRSTDSGAELYVWFDDEVLSEIRDETGVYLKEEIDRVTAFSSGGRGAIIVVEGAISQETQDKMLAAAALEGSLDLRTHSEKTYYHIGDERSNDDDLESLEDSAYFSFAIKNKLIVTTDEGQLKALIDSNGKIAGTGNKSGALFVLTADKEFMQAGMRTSGFGSDEIDWNSNILKNIEQAALLVSDNEGLISVEAKLISTDPRMAQSVASIVNGLISLQAFSSEMEPELAAILESTEVEVDDKVLSIKTVVDPKVIVDIIVD